LIFADFIKGKIKNKKSPKKAKKTSISVVFSAICCYLLGAT